MNQLQAAELEKRVREFADDWEPLLDLPGISVTHKFHDRYFDEENLDTTAANTVYQWEYRQAVIHWYLPTVARMDDNDIEMAVVHEYAHLLTGPVRDLITSNKHERLELATENVARALIFIKEHS